MSRQKSVLILIFRSTPSPLGRQRTVPVARHGELVRKPNPCTHFTLNQLPATRPQADVRFILLETAMGYLLFERKESDEIGATLPEVQAACKDYGKFSLVLKLKAQFFFRTAEEALLNINDVSEGIVTPGLKVTPQPAHTHSPRDMNPSPPAAGVPRAQRAGWQGGQEGQGGHGGLGARYVPAPTYQCYTHRLPCAHSTAPTLRCAHSATPGNPSPTLRMLSQAWARPSRSSSTSRACATT